MENGGESGTFGVKGNGGAIGTYGEKGTAYDFFIEKAEVMSQCGRPTHIW